MHALVAEGQGESHHAGTRGAEVDNVVLQRLCREAEGGDSEERGGAGGEEKKGDGGCGEGGEGDFGEYGVRRRGGGGSVVDEKG